MDRLNFVPGPAAREEIEDANHLICFEREGAMGFADEFLIDSGSITYQSALACLSAGDRIDITFKDNVTLAVLTEASEKKKELYRIDNNTKGLENAQAEWSVDFLRRALGGILHTTEPATQKYESVALSTTNLFNASGATWYFLLLPSPTVLPFPSSPSPPSLVHLSRPMRAFDALALAAIMTLITGNMPLVFGLLQKRPGNPPNKWASAKNTFDLDLNGSTDVWIIG